MKRFGGSVLLFVIGVVTGWWIRPTPSPPAATAATVPAPAEKAPSAPAVDPVVPAVGPARAASRTPVAPMTNASADAGPLPVAPALMQELARLTDDNDRLQREVAQLRLMAADAAEGRDDRGEPQARPDDLEERFELAALREAIDAAARALSTGAAVTSVDCTEFPCIVYGEGAMGPDGFTRLRASPGLAAYARDSARQFSWVRKDGDATREYFGIALWSPAQQSDRGAALEKRVSYRARLMSETFTAK